MAIVLLGLAVTWVSLDAAEGAPEAPKSAPEKIDFARDIGPLIKKYCHKCHTGDEPEGEFSLYFASEQDFRKRISAERAHFEKMSDVLRDYDMPPPDEAQPTDAERDRLVKWLDRDLLAPAAKAAGAPPTPPAASAKK